jgi:hypothetical protein
MNDQMAKMAERGIPSVKLTDPNYSHFNIIVL